MDKRQAILLTPDAYGGYPEVLWSSLSPLVFYVTCCNDISIIHVMAQMCRWTEEEVGPMVGLPMP